MTTNADRRINTETVLQFVYQVIAVTHIILGVAILFGGVEHFPFPTYQPLLDMTGGAVWPWGDTIIIAGIAMLIPNNWLNLLGLVLGFFWMNLFSAMFLIALVQYEGAGSTAPIPYATIGFIQVALLTLKVAELARLRRNRR